MELEELYQDIVLDHSRNPRNFGEPVGATVHVHGDNPMCGDEVSVHLGLDADGTLSPIGFTGNGCSICMASASLMTQKVKGKTVAESEGMVENFQKMLTSTEEIEGDRALGDARILKTVRQFPQRVKCATLAWHALHEALEAATAKTGEPGAGRDRQFSLDEA